MSGEEIKNIRDAMGLSQRKFAVILGVSERTVQNYEASAEVPDRVALLAQHAFSSSAHAKVETSPSVPPKHTDKEYAYLEDRINELQRRMADLESDMRRIAVSLLRKEYPEKHDAGGSGRNDRELPLGGYAI